MTTASKLWAVEPETAAAGADAAPGAAAAVSIRHARRTYTADLAPVRALRGIDLDVASGEFVAVTGPSGCGKSTLLNVIAGLDTLDEGTIEVDGQRVDGRDEDWLATFRRHHIGIVFQFFNLLDGVSALDNLVLPGVLGGMRRRAAEARARDLLDLLGLGDRAAQIPAVLSGGQRQRLAIARALVNEPTLLLADEPTGALDTAGGQEILELFRRLHAGGQTIVLVTHSPEVAAGAARQVRLRDGLIEADSAVPSDPDAPDTSRERQDTDAVSAELAPGAV
ncbi:MAG: ABC transporter ATP-binding protein [Geodermatophilaceae bacterium]|nr:ABC transporter ATP-binding protein [Geodermatophilaceae bacterium]